MKLSLLILFFASCITFTGCAPEISSKPPQTTTPSVAEYQKITAAQAKEKMNETNDWILLDVRTNEEFKEKRIEGAILMPDYEISNRAEAEISDKDTIILIYCRSGRRSAAAAHEMVKMGYTNVYDLGGIIDWPDDTING